MRLYDLTKQLLEQYEPLRDDDHKLTWAVWTKMGLTENGYITKENFYQSTPIESITRCRRKIQEKYPELQASQSVQMARKEIETQKGTHVFRDEIVVPFAAHKRFEGNVVVDCNCQIGSTH